MSDCKICGQPLRKEPMCRDYDCGGDCLECMARHGEDPECISILQTILLNEFYAEYSALVNKYMAEVIYIDDDNTFLMRLQEHSNVYSRDESA